MSSRRIAVDITGDPSNLEAALLKAKLAMKNFGRDVAQGPVVAPLSGVDKAFDQIDDRIRVRSRRASSIGPLRLAGIGLGAGVGLFAATQAAAKLGDALQVTGKEAFTTQGRISNMVAAFTHGDLVGGLQVIGRGPKTLDDLGLSAFEAQQKLEQLGLTSHQAVDGTESVSASARKAHDSYNQFAAATGKANLENQKIVSVLKNAVGAMEGAENAADALADANARMGTSFVTASGQVAMFKGMGPNDLGGMQGVGLANQINTNLQQSRGGRFGRQARLPDIAGTKNQQALILAQARGDLPEVLRLQKIDAARLKKVADKSTGDRKQHSAQVLAAATAEAAAIATQGQIDANAKAAADKANAAAKARAAKAKAAAEKAARDAERAREAYQRAVEQAQEENTRFLKKLQDNAEAMRDAATKMLSRRIEKRDVAREITQKQEQLALAVRVGSPHAIKQARDELADARTNRLIYMLEGAKIKPTRVATPGRAPGFAFAGTTIHIGNITLTGVQNPKDLLKALQRVPTSTGRRGRHGGTVHGI